MNGSKKEIDKHYALVEMNDLAYYLIDNVSVKSIGENKRITSLTNELACSSSQPKTTKKH